MCLEGAPPVSVLEYLKVASTTDHVGVLMMILLLSHRFSHFANSTPTLTHT
jgi:hypothetical protein